VVEYKMPDLVITERNETFDAAEIKVKLKAA
jgi:hypothetical protein